MSTKTSRLRSRVFPNFLAPHPGKVAQHSHRFRDRARTGQDFAVAGLGVIGPTPRGPRGHATPDVAQERGP